MTCNSATGDKRHRIEIALAAWPALVDIATGETVDDGFDGYAITYPFSAQDLVSPIDAEEGCETETMVYWSIDGTSDPATRWESDILDELNGAWNGWPCLEELTERDIDDLNAKVAAIIEKNRDFIRNGIDTEGQHLDGWKYNFTSTAPIFTGAIDV